jgi:hypothetical protein
MNVVFGSKWTLVVKAYQWITGLMLMLLMPKILFMCMFIVTTRPTPYHHLCRQFIGLLVCMDVVLFSGRGNGISPRPLAASSVPPPPPPPPSQSANTPQQGGAREAPKRSNTQQRLDRWEERLNKYRMSLHHIISYHIIMHTYPLSQLILTIVLIE